MKKKILLSACAAILSGAIAIDAGIKAVNAEETSYGTFFKPEELGERVTFSQPFGYAWDSLKYSGVSGDGNRFEMCLTNDNRSDLGLSSGYNVGFIPYAHIGCEETVNSFLISSTFEANYVDGSEASQDYPLPNSEMDNLGFVNFGYGFSVGDVGDSLTNMQIFFRDVKYLDAASIDIILFNDIHGNGVRYRLMSDEINGLAQDFERTGTIKFEFAQVCLSYYGMDDYRFSFALKTDNHCVSYGNFPLVYTLSGNEELFKCENSSSTEGSETSTLKTLFFPLSSKPIHGNSSNFVDYGDYMYLFCTGNYSKSEKLPDLNYGDFVTNVLITKNYSDVADVYAQMYNFDHDITDGGDDNPKQDKNTTQGDSSVNGFTPAAKRILAIAFGVTAVVGVFTVASTVIRGRERRKGARRK